MGYQKVILKLSTSSYEEGFVFNGEYFFKQNELASLSAAGIWLAERSTEKTSLSIFDITVIPRPPAQLRNVRRVAITALNASGGQYYTRSQYAGIDESTVKASASQAAKDAPITLTNAGEVFKRFSAYENDFRITEKRGLVAGTFATTAEDAENVKTGRDAVSRYALENKQSANKRFTINPVKDTSLQRGVVQPAYGEPGGGVEVIFVNGTGDYTVSGPDLLPE
jgi:hypothetical protein